MPPKRSTARAAMSCADSGLETSVWEKTASPPSPSIPAATLGPASEFRSATTTAAPSDASARAYASPIPCAAPVTIATLPANRPSALGIRLAYSSAQAHGRAGEWPELAVAQPAPSAKTNLVGLPVKSAESRANTQSGRRAKTLLDAGSTMSSPYDVPYLAFSARSMSRSASRSVTRAARPSTTTGSRGLSEDTVQRDCPAMLRALREPLELLNHSRPSCHSAQTGMRCGVPFGVTVASQ